MLDCCIRAFNCWIIVIERSILLSLLKRVVKEQNSGIYRWFSKVQNVVKMKIQIHWSSYMFTLRRKLPAENASVQISGHMLTTGVKLRSKLESSLLACYQLITIFSIPFYLQNYILSSTCLTAILLFYLYLQKELV